MNILPVPKIIGGVPPVFSKEHKCALDVELFGLDEKRLHRPKGRFGSLACTVNGETVYITFNPDLITPFLKNCEQALHIYHNASFDLGHLRRWTPIEVHKRLWDTMLIEKIMWSGWYDNNQMGLNDLVRRYCDGYLEKKFQKEFKETDEWTQEKIEYSARDVVATWMVYHEQRKIISDDDLEIYKQIDLPTMWLTLGFKGVMVDTKRWINICNKNADKVKEIKDDLDFNPGSSQQSKQALLNDGIVVESTNAKVLEHLVSKTPLAQKIMDARTYTKRVTTYGEKWVEQFVDADGRVYASWQVSEAITGRMSCRSPNLQNIPIRDTPEYRECFIAGEGNSFVIADYSAQEPRFAAELSGDKRLIEIFNSGKEIYIEIAKETFGENITISDPRRNDIKEIVIGSCNGMTEWGLAKKLKKTKDEALELQEKYFSTFPGLWEYRENVKNKRPKYVQTVCGRKTWLNLYVYGWERVGMDAPLQGSASEALKLSMIEFVEKWGCSPLDNPIVLPVHDEIVLEIPESMAKLAAQMLEETMLDVAQRLHPSVKPKVEIKIGKRWSDKK